MSDFLRSYLTVGLVGLTGALFAGLMLTVSRIIRPNRVEGQKSLTYESGAEPANGGWSQSHVRYYLYALLFVIFDVEVLFIVPWAVQVKSFGVFGLIEMGLFVVILALGLAYAWRKNVLTWD